MTSATDCLWIAVGLVATGALAGLAALSRVARAVAATVNEIDRRVDAIEARLDDPHPPPSPEERRLRGPRHPGRPGS